MGSSLRLFPTTSNWVEKCMCFVQFCVAKGGGCAKREVTSKHKRAREHLKHLKRRKPLRKGKNKKRMLSEVKNQCNDLNATQKHSSRRIIQRRCRLVGDLMDMGHEALC